MTIIIARSWQGGAIVASDTQRTDLTNGSLLTVKKMHIVNKDLIVAAGGPGSLGVDKVLQDLGNPPGNRVTDPTSLWRFLDTSIRRHQTAADTVYQAAGRAAAPPISVLYAFRSASDDFQVGKISWDAQSQRVAAHLDSQVETLSAQTHQSIQEARAIEADVIARSPNAFSVTRWAYRCVSLAASRPNSGIGLPMHLGVVVGNVDAGVRDLAQQDDSNLACDLCVTPNALHGYRA